jgi:hypothetical protein
MFSPNHETHWTVAVCEVRGAADGRETLLRLSRNLAATREEHVGDQLVEVGV